jgi:hypothetical protein
MTTPSCTVGKQGVRSLTGVYPSCTHEVGRHRLAADCSGLSTWATAAAGLGRTARMSLRIRTSGGPSPGFSAALEGQAEHEESHAHRHQDERNRWHGPACLAQDWGHEHETNAPDQPAPQAPDAVGASSLGPRDKDAVSGSRARHLIGLGPLDSAIEGVGAVACRSWLRADTNRWMTLLYLGTTCCHRCWSWSEIPVEHSGSTRSATGISGQLSV